MIRIITTAFAAAAVAIGLSACDMFKPMTAETAAGVAGGMTVAAVTPETAAQIADMCALGGAALDAASQVYKDPKMRLTAVPAAAYCKPILAGVPPQAAPNTDSNTKRWLSAIIEALPSLARAAQVVLPAIVGR